MTVAGVGGIYLSLKRLKPGLIRILCLTGCLTIPPLGLLLMANPVSKALGLI